MKKIPSVPLMPERPTVPQGKLRHIQKFGGSGNMIVPPICDSCSISRAKNLYAEVDNKAWALCGQCEAKYA